jgi:octopine/nopaline transport system permease protein
MSFEAMRTAAPALLAGLPLTLELAALSLVLGFGLAVLVALARLHRLLVLSLPAAAYIYVFRGTPLLVQIFLIYYGLGQLLWVRESAAWVVLREPFWCAILALTLNTGAYSAEIIRGGIQSVPWGQVEAARACGMSGWLLLRRIVFPIAIRQALPAYGNEIILMVKSTSLASTITLLEVTGVARKIIVQTFLPVEIFIVAGGIYLAVNFLVTRGVRWLERRLSPYQVPRPRDELAPAADAR